MHLQCDHTHQPYNKLPRRQADQALLSRPIAKTSPERLLRCYAQNLLELKESKSYDKKKEKDTQHFCQPCGKSFSKAANPKEHITSVKLDQAAGISASNDNGKEKDNIHLCQYCCKSIMECAANNLAK